jgi:hypothetical protein
MSWQQWLPDKEQLKREFLLHIRIFCLGAAIGAAVMLLSELGWW